MKIKEKRNWLLYIVGASVSEFGSLIYTFAAGLYVLDMTGSSIQFATTLVIALIPNLVLAPFAGFFADRFNRKLIVILMDILNGLLFLCAFLMTNIMSVNIQIIYLTLLLTNIFSSFFAIAMESAKPQLVSDDNLTAINSVSQIIMGAANILYPIIGGLIYGWMGLQQFMLINGISFLISALSEIYIDFNYNKAQLVNTRFETTNIMIATKDAFIYLIRNKNLVYMMFFFFIVNLAISIGVQVPLPYILYNHFDMDTNLYGIVSATFPIGLIIGALLVKFLANRFEQKTIVHIGGGIIGIITILVGLPYYDTQIHNITSIAVYYGIVSIFCGYGIALVDITIRTIFQQNVDSPYRGRVMGLFRSVIKVANPIGFIYSGYMLGKMNPFWVPLQTGIVFIIIFCVYLLIQRNRGQAHIENIPSTNRREL